jgi:hypothetical protein
MVLSNPMNVTLDNRRIRQPILRVQARPGNVVDRQSPTNEQLAPSTMFSQRDIDAPLGLQKGNVVVLVVDGFVTASTTAISAASTRERIETRRRVTQKPGERTCFPFHLRRCLESRSIKSSDFKDEMMPIHPPPLRPLLSRDTEPTPHSFIVASRTRVDYSQAPRIR